MDAKRHIKGDGKYEEALPHLVNWWNFWKFPVPPITSLPLNMIVIYNKDIPLAAGFIYQTDSDIAWLEWIVASHTAKKEERSKALDLLIDSGKVAAQMLGHSVVFTCSKNQSLSHRLKRTMIHADDGVSHFV